MLRISTFNVNGIRAVHRRGFMDWFHARTPDVVALQEVRCRLDDLPEFGFAGMHAAYDPGTLAGRNGVAILTRTPPLAVRAWGSQVHLLSPDGEIEDAATGFEPLSRPLKEFTAEGRYIEVDLADRPVTVASLYLPKGGLPAHLQKPNGRELPDGGARYERKMRFLDGFARQVTASRRRARAAGRDYLLMGDFNIAHAPLDVVNWKRQHRTEGFLPEERDWLDGLIGPRRLIDVVRRLRPDEQGPYSWWSWLGSSFANDTGWRIDLHLASPSLARSAVAGGTDRDAHRDARMSDHAPVTVDYDV